MREGEGAVTGVREGHASGRDCDTLTDEELGDDVEGEHGKTCFRTQDLKAERAERLT